MEFQKRNYFYSIQSRSICKINEERGIISIKPEGHRQHGDFVVCAIARNNFFRFSRSHFLFVLWNTRNIYHWLYVTFHKNGVEKL